MKTSLIKYFVFLFFLNITEGFRCDYKYSSKTRGWFKSFVVPATWFDARLRCSLEGTVLASPITPEIQAEMRNIINTSNPEYKIFTGIHATFSQGEYYTIEGTPLSDIPVTWAKNEPDNKDNKEKCITLNGNGELADHRCEDTRPYICYRPGRFQTVNECGTVDPEYKLDRRTNKCYKFHTVPRIFSRAFMACSAEGGHLAVVNSELEATVLKELYNKYSNAMIIGNIYQKDYAFIGFHTWGENEFRTIHDQTLTEAGYNIWKSGEPNNMTPPGESCGSISRYGVYNDLGCDTEAAFLCEKDPGYPDVCPADSK